MTEMQNWLYDNITQPHVEAAFFSTTHYRTGEKHSPAMQFAGMGIASLAGLAQFYSGAAIPFKLIGARGAHLKKYILPPTLGFVHTFKTSGAKFVLSKIGSRAIPFLGWALLGYDAYDFGKTGRFWGVPISDEPPLRRLERFFFI